jgi:hypothetical protein
VGIDSDGSSVDHDVDRDVDNEGQAHKVSNGNRSLSRIGLGDSKMAARGRKQKASLL